MSLFSLKAAVRLPSLVSGRSTRGFDVDDGNRDLWTRSPAN